MSRQINLFDPSLRPARPFLTLANLALLLVAFAGLLALYAGWAEARARREEAELAQVDARLKALQAQVATLGAGAAPGRDARLEASIGKAEEELRARQRLLDQVRGGHLGNTHGFSDFMGALARQRVEGVWITGLSVGDGGRTFRIQGGVTRPELVSEYIQRLNREDAIRGKSIDDLRMERREVAPRDSREAAAAASRPKFIEFTIASGAPRAGAGG